MYLIDTNVISETRNGSRADNGARECFKRIVRDRVDVFLSVVSFGELWRGIELIRHWGDSE